MKLIACINALDSTKQYGSLYDLIIIASIFFQLFLEGRNLFAKCKDLQKPVQRNVQFVWRSFVILGSFHAVTPSALCVCSDWLIIASLLTAGPSVDLLVLCAGPSFWFLLQEYKVFPQMPKWQLNWSIEEPCR